MGENLYICGEIDAKNMTGNILAILLSVMLLQGNPAVVWKAAINHTDGTKYELVVTGKVAKGYYVHPMGADFVGTQLEVNEAEGVALDGEVKEEFEPADYKGETVVKGTYVLRQGLVVDGAEEVAGTVTWSACSGDACGMPEDYEFRV